MSLENNINKFFERETLIEGLLSKSSELKSSELAELSKELFDIKLITDLARKKQLITKELLDLNQIQNDTSADDDIKKMANTESDILKEEVINLEKDIQFALLPKDKDDTRNVIIEVRAGTGGDEAGLFASDLFAMYQKLCPVPLWSPKLVLSICILRLLWEDFEVLVFAFETLVYIVRVYDPGVYCR